MLVLQRRRREQIVIGGEIVITVLRLESGSVRLGIEAPRDVAIERRDAAEGEDH